MMPKSSTHCIVGLVIYIAFCGATSRVYGQYCGARCIVRSCELLKEPLPDLVRTIETLNGKEFERLPSLAQVSDCAASLGLYSRLVDLEVLPQLRFRDNCVAILHVNGSHFVVYEGYKNGFHRIWWGPQVERNCDWREVCQEASPVGLIVAGHARDIIENEILTAEVCLRWRRFILAIPAIGLGTLFVLFAVFRGKRVLVRSLPVLLGVRK